MKNKLVTNETILKSVEEVKQALCKFETPLTYKEFADRFGYEVSTVRKKVSKGELPKRKLAGRPVIYLSDLRN